MTPEETAWVAGIFEGEGSIGDMNKNGVRLTVTMTDRDVVERLHRLTGVGTVRFRRPGGEDKAHWKDQYVWRVGRAPDVEYLLKKMLPFLGQRRGARARDALTRLSGCHPKLSGHCGKHHELTPENVFVDSRGYSYCRTCKNAWQRDYTRRLRGR